MTDVEVDQCRRDGALLLSIVADQVKLKRQGRDWKGCCPFHPDDDPSFVVYETAISTVTAAALTARFLTLS
jgi:hypothetical protein